MSSTSRRRCAAGPSLAPLLGAGAPTALLPHLRAPPPRQWADASVAGTPGAPLDAADEALVQLKPLRAFFAGEIVAVQSDGGYKFAAIDVARAADAPADEARQPVALRAPELVHVSPLSLYSFRSQRHFSLPKVVQKVLQLVLFLLLGHKHQQRLRAHARLYRPERQQRGAGAPFKGV